MSESLLYDFESHLEGRCVLVMVLHGTGDPLHLLVESGGERHGSGKRRNGQDSSWVCMTDVATSEQCGYDKVPKVFLGCSGRMKSL